MVMNSLSFCLSENVLIFPLVFQGQFCQIYNIWLTAFSFSTLNVSVHYLLASKVSDDKSANNLIEDPLYMISHFFLATFKVLFVFGFWPKFNYNVYHSVSLWVQITWNSLSFLDTYIHVFYQNWEVSNHYSSNSLPDPFFFFWDLHNACVCLLDVVPQVT